MGKYEKTSTKKCKHCQSEIPSKAKVCPHCRKKVKGGKLKWVILALVAILLISFAGGSNGDNATDAKKVGEVTPPVTQTPENKSTGKNKPEPSEPKTETKALYSVGDILQDGDLQIVYMSSGDYVESNEFMQPEEGYKYIYLQFAFINTSDKNDASISSISFNAYADGYAAESYFGGSEDLSATLSAGRSTTGFVYFTVPENAAEIDVEYETNVFTGQKIHFAFDGEKDSGYVLETNSTATPDAHSVGDLVESNRLNITYLSCEEYISDNMFVLPKDGYHFISCEFEFENVGDSDEFVSSFDFDCYADGINCPASYIREDDLSATLSAGRKTKGTVTFEVPIDAEVVEVEYLSNYWTSNRVVFSAK